jgi:hypothetical protein
MLGSRGAYPANQQTNGLPKLDRGDFEGFSLHGPRKIITGKLASSTG